MKIKFNDLYCVSVFLLMFGLSASMIGGSLNIYDTYFLSVKSIYNAKIISTETFVSTCRNSYRIGDSHYTSDPFTCYKTRVNFCVSCSNNQTNINNTISCVYSDSVWSLNITEIAIYAKYTFPINSTTSIYISDGLTNNIQNCKIASDKFIKKNNKLKNERYNSGIVALAGISTLTVSSLILYYILNNNINSSNNIMICKKKLILEIV